MDGILSLKAKGLRSKPSSTKVSCRFGLWRALLQFIALYVCFASKSNLKGSVAFIEVRLQQVLRRTGTCEFASQGQFKSFLDAFLSLIFGLAFECAVLPHGLKLLNFARLKQQKAI